MGIIFLGMDKEEKKVGLSSIKDLLKNIVRVSKVVWKYKRRWFLALTFLTLISSFLPSIISGFQGLFIDEIVANIGLEEISFKLIIYLGVMVAARAFEPFIFSGIGYFDKMFYFFIEEKFQILLLEKRGEIDIAVHEDPKMSNFFRKVEEGGVWHFQNFFAIQFDLFRDLVAAVIASVIIISFNWWVFLLVLIFSIPQFIISIKYGYSIWNIHGTKSEIKRRFYNLESHFMGISSLMELKLFKNIKYFISSISELFLEFQNEEKKNEKKRITREMLAAFMSQLAIGFSIIYFALSVIKGNLTIGSFTFAISSIGGLRAAFSSFFKGLGRHYEDNLFVTDLFKFLDIEPVIEKPAKGLVINSKRTPSIVFENVSFSYPGTDKLVLDNFSLKIEPGEKVALVGVNGAGKTTFVKLLCRFYDPNKGRILVNGKDLKDLDLESWYENIGVLFQDYSNYHFQVRESIAIGRTGIEAKIKKIQEAAKAAEADIFIEEWEKKYDQMLGKWFTDGLEPSIGQWQKLALARTFYRDPKVLILDEPTSSIDAEAEAKIFEKLEKLPSNRSVILISHRFSTVRKANKIVVIENGKVSEEGTHAKLLRNNKTYARLFKIQAKGYK